MNSKGRDGRIFPHMTKTTLNALKKFVPLVTSRHSPSFFSILSRIVVISFLSSFLPFDKISCKQKEERDDTRKSEKEYGSLLKELQLFFPSRKTSFFFPSSLSSLFLSRTWLWVWLHITNTLFNILFLHHSWKTVRFSLSCSCHRQERGDESTCVRIRWQGKGKGSWWCDRGHFYSLLSG